MSLKSQKTRRDNAVQGTNDSSIVSKCSMSQCGYFDDKFLQHFVSKKIKRSPLINRGYYIRAKAVEYVFETFMKNQVSNKIQIVSLGAGFDSSYFRLKNKGCLKNAIFVEIDFPDVMKRKVSLIKNSDLLSQMIEDVCDDVQQKDTVLKSRDYIVIGLDLTQVERLTECLKQHKVDANIPTMILSEVVLTYMPHLRCNKVISWCSQFFSNAAMFAYEQVHPDDGFGQVMMSHFKKLGSPLRCINTYPGLEEQVKRYKVLGWDSASAVDMNYFYNEYIEELERRRVEQLEPFDEFEEWHLKCMHYILISSFKGEQKKLQEKFFRSLDKQPSHKNYCSAWFESGLSSTSSERAKVPCTVIDSTHFSSTEWSCRHSHKAVVTDGHLLVITGGFGKLDKKHGRLKQLTVIDLNTGRIITASLDNANRKASTSEEELNTSLRDSTTVVTLGDDTTAVSHKTDSELKDPDTPSGKGVKDVSPVERLHHTCTLLPDNRVLVFGGRKSPLSPCSDVCVIKVWRKNGEINEDQGSCCDSGITVEWEPVQSPDSVSGPCPRWRHTATLISHLDEDYVMIYGGKSVGTEALNDCFLLNTKTFSWHQVSLDGCPIGGLHSHSACVYHNSVVISGGLTTTQQPSASLYSIRLQKHSGHYTGHVQKLELAGEIQPRYSHCSAVVRGCVMLVGGISTDFPTPSVTLINLETGNFQNLELQWSTENQPLLLHNHEVWVKSEEEILVFGGGGNCFSFGTHLNQGLISINLQQHHFNF